MRPKHNSEGEFTTIDLQKYGYAPNKFDEKNLTPARITAVHRERYELICQNGEGFGRLKGSAFFAPGSGGDYPTTGDFALIEYNDAGDSLIVKTLPRASFFSRKDPTPGRGEQAVAANFDYVFILTSLNHDLNLKRVERYLTLGWQSGATPVIVLTKADLTDSADEQIAAIETVAMGVDIIPVSAKSGAGLDRLNLYLQPGKTIVFLGSSGVGKSSLVNALAGSEVMAVQDIREDDSKGRHTTTHRQLIMLPSGVMIIDTPGMRELGMWDVTSGLGSAFADVEEILSRPCRFSDCKHNKEPGCAVRAALDSGELDKGRWKRYIALKKEARYSDDPAAAIREQRQWGKNIAKINRQRGL